MFSVPKGYFDGCNRVLINGSPGFLELQGVYDDGSMGPYLTFSAGSCGGGNVKHGTGWGGSAGGGGGNGGSCLITYF